MEPTQDAYRTGGLIVGGVGLAWLLASPSLLLIPIAIGAHLLARQYQCLQDTTHTLTGSTVTQSFTAQQVRAHQQTTLTIDVDIDTPPDVGVALTPRLPAALHTDTEPVQLDDGQQSISVVVASEIAGRYEVPPPELTITSRDGRFTVTTQLGTAVSLTVTPAGPREIHVGEGGERFAAAYGEHPAGKGGAGLDPSELRKYLPGDPTNRIDWKATARLNEPHVREFEAETDRETRIIIDTRPSMHEGVPGETKLEYARQLALAFVDSASHLGDPLGLTTVDQTGITTSTRTASTPTHYHHLRTTLHDLTPTTPTTTHRHRQHRGPDTAHRAATRLAGDASPFARLVRPLLADREAYVQRLGDQPVFRTVQRELAQHAGRTWTILITDDTASAETREAVKLARRHGGHVLVCLLPSILYERASLSDLDTAYDRYRAFESGRRSLASIEGVRALEVGPRDRLAAILTQRKRGAAQA